MKTIFAKYNSERLPKYQIVTKIVEDNNKKRYAIKEPLCEEAQEHINNIYKNYELLKSNYDINLVKPTKVESGLLFEMAEGSSLENILLHAINNNDEEKFQKYINNFLNLLDSMIYKRDVMFEPSKEFEEVFGRWNIDEPQDIIKVANIDMIFGNIFVNEKDEFTFIDYEWVFDFEIPKKFVIWRSLAIFFTYHNIDINKFYKIDNDLFLAMDYKFSDIVHGKNKKYFLTPIVRKDANFLNFEEKKNDIISNYFIQLFIEDKNGISEENSIKYPVLQTTELQRFEFDLKDIKDIRNLRLDPLNNLCVIEIQSIKIITNNEENELIECISSNSIINHGENYFFDTEDPNIYFKGTDVDTFQNTDKLIVAIRFVHIGKDALRVSIKQTKTELDQTKQALDAKSEEINNLKIELTSLYTSKSWKLTRPLRSIMRKLSK